MFCDTIPGGLNFPQAGSEKRNNEKKNIQNARKGKKGQSLVEFALVVPMLLLLVFGIAEFGRAWMTRIS